MPISTLVNLKTAAALSGRSEATIRAWIRRGDLHPAPTGRLHGRGQVRHFDVTELEAVNLRHGGIWYGERFPRLETVETQALASEVTHLRLQVNGLRAQVDAMRDEMTQLRTALSGRQIVAHGASSALQSPHLARPPEGARPSRPSAPREPAPPSRSAAPESRREGREDGVRLPDGFVAVKDFARQHGSRESQNSTFKNAVWSNRLPIVRGNWRERGHHVEMALDGAGRHQFWELWHRTTWFVPCAECPHPLLASAPTTQKLVGGAEDGQDGHAARVEVVTNGE